MKSNEERIEDLEKNQTRLSFCIGGLLLMLIIVWFTSCVPAHKMVMPMGCKPKPPKEYKMIEPTIHPHAKKFMISEPKTQYDLDKRKQLEETGK